MSSSILSSKEMTYDHVSLPDHLREALVALLDVHPGNADRDVDVDADDRDNDHQPDDDEHVDDPDPPLLPPGLSARLAPFLAPSSESIPHSLLLSISQHVRTLPPSVLTAHSLDPSDYTMISLLAGVRTLSSATSEPLPTSKASSDTLTKQWQSDRRALSAVINALVSIGGVGFAAYYAAGSAGWRPEWQALIALFAGLVVALSEGVLFVIWQDRLEKRRARQKAKRRRPSAPHEQKETILDSAREEKEALPEPEGDVLLEPSSELVPSAMEHDDQEVEQTLRRRHAAVPEPDAEDT